MGINGLLKSINLNKNKEGKKNTRKNQDKQKSPEKV